MVTDNFHLTQTLLDENTVLGYKNGWNLETCITSQIFMEESCIWLRFHINKTILNRKWTSPNRFLKFKIFFDELSQNIYAAESNLFSMKRDFFKVNLSLSDLVLWLSNVVFNLLTRYFWTNFPYGLRCFSQPVWL